MIDIRFKDSNNSILEFIKNKIIPNCDQVHRQNIQFMREYSKVYNDWKILITRSEEKLDLFKITAELHKKLEKQLRREVELKNSEVIFEQYHLLKKRLEEFLDKIELDLKFNQEPYHFNPSESDSRKLRFLKSIKRTGFSLSSRFYHIVKGKEAEYKWTRKIPLKNMITHHIQNYLNKILTNSERYSEYFGKLIISLTAEQKELDKSFINEYIPFLENVTEKNFDNSFLALNSKIELIIKELDDAYNNFIATIVEELHNEFETLSEEFKIVGTIEFPYRKFSHNKTSKEIAYQEKRFNKSTAYRQRFISAIFDRKEYYEDLLWFTFLLIGESYTIKSFGNYFIGEKIDPILNLILKEINSSINSLKESENDLKAAIVYVEDHLRKSLDQNLVQAVIKQISSNVLSEVFSRYLKSIDENLNEFEKEYSFVKPKDVNYELEQYKLKKFSPKEIISPIVVKKINVKTKEILDEFETEVSKLNASIIGLGRIIEYNLDSAKIKFSEEKSSNEESMNIAIEGLTRAIGKTEDFKEKLENFISEVTSKFETVIKDLIGDIIALSDIDQLITIKIQVSKQKALQEAKDKFHKSYEKLTVWYRWLKQKSTILFFTSKEKIAGISSKVGLGSSEIELSEAMADYLVRVTESLEKLPYVYQRLFSNEQLTDERMFEGRTEEVDKLGKAISYWQNNQITSVMIIGEKGSGTSSLINIALKRHLSDQNIFRNEFGGTLYNEEKLLSLLSNLLKLQNITSVDQLITTINGFQEKVVVVIENIEDFFLRIVEGFTAITKLLEIITATNKKVFWITTCNLYAWEYLNKVVNIKDYFIFNIKLQGLDEKLIKSIILSRHNISGYNLYFLPSPEIKVQKSFSKMSDPERQDYLKHVYFEKLYELTSNNIAVALFYWLRSIVKIDEEQIEVSVELDFDFSFLKALSAQKLFTLMAIILHDGLSYEEHSKIFNMKLKESQLLFASLSDDGIIFLRGRNYKINFQLYTAIIKLLKDKNILH